MTLNRRRRRWIVVTGALLAVYTVTGFFLAPPIIRAQAIKRLSAELGREVSIEKFRLNPFALSVAIEGLEIKDRDGAVFAGWRRVYVNFDAGSFLSREWRFQEIAASAPTLRVVVNKDGSFNFSDLISKSQATAPTPPQTSTPKQPAWPLRVASLVVSDAVLDFADHSRSAEFSTRAGPVSFALKDFHTATGTGAPYEFSAATEAGEKLTWRGTVTASQLASQGEFSLSGIQLPKYAPYYRDLVRFELVGGSVDFSGRYEVGMSDSTKPRANLAGGSVRLSGLRLAPRGEKNAVMELDDLVLTGIEASLEKFSAAIGKVELTGGRFSAQRLKNGEVDLAALLQPAAAPMAKATDVHSAPTVSPAAGAPKMPDVKVAEVLVRKFSATFTDQATPRPAVNRVENFEADFKNVTLAEGAVIPVRVALALAEQGTVQIEGDVSLLPLKADFAVDFGNLGLVSVSPYIEPMLNLRIARGTVSGKGRAGLSLPSGAEPKLSFRGDVSVDRFSTVAGELNDEFSSWSALAIRGIDFNSAPLAVGIGEIGWNDLAAHLIVNRDGTNNLAAVLKAPAPATAGAAVPAASAAPATPPAIANTAPPAPAALPPITVGKISFANGSFTFSDRSLAPAVHTAINQFSGTIAGLSSANLARADVDLKATVDGIGPIVIRGKLDPLAAEKFVDLKIDFKNVDLTPFSPYAAKYAGYQLARGKLFLDVTARLDGRKVDVANVLTLNQFTFGAASNSPDATKLPVRLGVALLKDTEGKMIIDIPVAGSLDDPEFRIGRVVWRVIGNLLTKAATSPFSLLGSMFGGGGDELAYQEFPAGSNEPSPQDAAKLATLVKALVARPGLNLEVAGSFDATTDAAALQRQHLARQIRAKIGDARRAIDPSANATDPAEITAEEEAEWVRKLFAEKFPESAPVSLPPAPPAPVAATPTPAPRGLIGRVIDVVTFKNRSAEATLPPSASPAPAVPAPLDPAPELTVEEMKTRLAAAVVVAGDDLNRLASARAQRIREHFLAQQIAPDRLFLRNEPASQGARVLMQLQ